MNRYKIEGVELAVSVSGGGRPLLLIHGFPFDHSMWDAVVAEIHAKSTQSDGTSQYRIIVPDLRGFGQSDGPEHGGTTVSMERHADDLDALLYSLTLTDKIMLCGLSMGGYVVQAFAKKYASKLAGLILCDTRAHADAPEVALNRRRLAEHLDDGSVSLESIAVDMLPKLLTPETINAAPQIVRVATCMMTRHRPFGIAASARGMAERPDSTDALKDLDVPMLVLRGEADTLSNREEMRAIADGVKHGRYAEIPDAGHLGPLERPVGYAAEILRFCETLR